MTKYEPLTHYLQKNTGSVRLTYSEIEKIIGDELPPSATEYQEWWGNDDDTHPQSISWRKAGYKVSQVELGKYVIFSKS